MEADISSIYVCQCYIKTAFTLFSETFFFFHRVMELFCVIYRWLGQNQRDRKLRGYLGEFSWGNFCCRIEQKFDPCWLSISPLPIMPQPHFRSGSPPTGQTSLDKRGSCNSWVHCWTRFNITVPQKCIFLTEINISN